MAPGTLAECSVRRILCLGWGLITLTSQLCIHEEFMAETGIVDAAPGIFLFFMVADTICRCFLTM